MLGNKNTVVHCLFVHSVLTNVKRYNVLVNVKITLRNMRHLTIADS